MPLESEILTDGEVGFVGMASRDNPIAIQSGYVQYAQNIRTDRGVATVRLGATRKTQGDAIGQTIFASGVFSDSVTGIERIVLVSDGALYVYNTADFTFTTVNYPAGQVVAATDVVDTLQADDKFFIFRGQVSGKPVMYWDGSAPIVVMPNNVLSGSNATFPPTDFGIYFQNRIVVKRDRDNIAASDILDFGTWDLTFNQFKINLGANDSIVGFLPWQEDKIVLFQRNSIYYAYIDPNGYTTGAGPGGGSYVKTLTFDIGCNARRSIVNAGDHIFFLSDSGVHILTPSLDLKLLGNQQPLSAPIADIISKINISAASGGVGRIHNNRYYLAVPINGATRNNAVLVYSMLNKAWESIDIYPTGMFIDNFCIALQGQGRRMFATSREGGIFLLEEAVNDEFEVLTNNPVIPFVLPAVINTSYLQHSVAGQVLTRRYHFGSFAEKRFSSARMDFSLNAGDSVQVTAIASNPDSSQVVLSFGSGTDEDYTKRVRIAQRGAGVDLLVESVTGRPTIRGLSVDAAIVGGRLVGAS